MLAVGVASEIIQEEAQEGCKAEVPHLFGNRGRFCGRQFFHRPGWEWFRDDSSALIVDFIIIT